MQDQYQVNLQSHLTKSGKSGLLVLQELADPRYYADAPEDLKKKIRQEMTGGLFTVVRYGAVASMLLSTFVAPLLLRSEPLWEIIVWYIAVNCISILRHMLASRYLKTNPPYEEQNIWRRRLLVLTTLLSISWASLIGVTWGTQDPVVIGFVLFVQTALASSSYSTLGSYLKMFAVTLIPGFGVLILYFLHIGSGPAVYVIIFAVLVFTLSLLNASTKATQLMHSIFVLVHQNQDLAYNLQEKSALLSTTLHVITDGVITTDDTGKITYLNPAAQSMTGYSAEAAIGRQITEVLHLKDEAQGGKDVNIKALLDERGEAARKIPGDLVLTTSEVNDVPVNATISLLQLEDSNAAGFVMTLHDIASLRMLNRELSYDALHDPLTGLLNRRGFETHLTESLIRSSSRAQPNCLCLLDLDYFKQINDTCGHHAGDEVLKQIVTVIQEKIRDSDTFARLGGDEFAVILHGCSLEKARQIAQSIVDAVQAYRYVWEGREFVLGVSIGLALFAAKDSPETLTQAADEACYKAKQSGREQVCIAQRG